MLNSVRALSIITFQVARVEQDGIVWLHDLEGIQIVWSSHLKHFEQIYDIWLVSS